MEVVVLFCFTVQRKTVRAKYVLEPRMTEQLRKCYPLFWLDHKHPLD
jgi:hypothetical protein